MTMYSTSTSTLTLPQSFLSALTTSAPEQATPHIESQQLFGSGTLLFIGHNGEQYRLQRTRANKLILTK